MHAFIYLFTLLGVFFLPRPPSPQNRPPVPTTSAFVIYLLVYIKIFRIFSYSVPSNLSKQKPKIKLCRKIHFALSCARSLLFLRSPRRSAVPSLRRFLRVGSTHSRFDYSVRSSLSAICTERPLEMYIDKQTEGGKKAKQKRTRMMNKESRWKRDVAKL